MNLLKTSTRTSTETCKEGGMDMDIKKEDGTSLETPEGLTIGNLQPDHTFSFYINNEEVLRIEEEGKVFWNGEQVDDNKECWNAFRYFMQKANVLGMETGKPPLTLDIYDHRNIVVRQLDKHLGFIQGISINATSTDMPTIEAVVPEPTDADMTEEQHKAMAETIRILQEHGARVHLTSWKDLVPEQNPEEQAQAEKALVQLGLANRSVRTAIDSIRDSVSQPLFSSTQEATINYVINVLPSMVNFILGKFESLSRDGFEIEVAYTADEKIHPDAIEETLEEFTKPLFEKGVNTIIHGDHSKLTFKFEPLKRETLIKSGTRTGIGQIMAQIKPVSDVVREKAGVGMLTPNVRNLGGSVALEFNRHVDVQEEDFELPEGITARVFHDGDSTNGHTTRVELSS